MPSEDEHRNPCDVGSCVGSHRGVVVSADAPRQSQPGLAIVEVVRNAGVGGEAGTVQVGCEVRVPGFDEDVGVRGPVPAQAKIQRFPLARIPRILYEGG